MGAFAKRPYRVGLTLVETTVGGSWQGSPTNTAASQLHSRGIRDAGSMACSNTCFTILQCHRMSYSSIILYMYRLCDLQQYTLYSSVVCCTFCQTNSLCSINYTPDHCFVRVPVQSAVVQTQHVCCLNAAGKTSCGRHHPPNSVLLKSHFCWRDERESTEH